MHQPVDGVGGSGPAPGPLRVAPAARVQTAAPTERPAAPSDTSPTSRLRSLAMSAPAPASDPARLAQARARLASGWYHSPDGVAATAQALLDGVRG